MKIQKNMKCSVCINYEGKKSSRLKNISRVSNDECCHLSTLYRTLHCQVLCKQGLIIWLNADIQRKFDKEDKHGVKAVQREMRRTAKMRRRRRGGFWQRQVLARLLIAR